MLRLKGAIRLRLSSDSAGLCTDSYPFPDIRVLVLVIRRVVGHVKVGVPLSVAVLVVVGVRVHVHHHAVAVVQAHLQELAKHVVQVVVVTCVIGLAKVIALGLVGVLVSVVVLEAIIFK